MITIREANKLEIETISNFQVEMALETENVVLDKSKIIQGIKAVFDDPNKGQYYIALGVDNNKMGCLLTTYEWSEWRNGMIFWIQSVFVAKQFRKMGVYKELYLHIKRKVESKKNFVGIRLYVDKTNIQAQTVYKKLGMDGEHYQLFEWIK